MDAPYIFNFITNVLFTLIYRSIAGQQPNYTFIENSKITIDFNLTNLVKTSDKYIFGDRNELDLGIDKNTGIISSKDVIDREYVCPNNSQSTPCTFMLQILKLKHNPMRIITISNITITIKDMNDNKPTWTQSNYNVSFKEHCNTCSKIIPLARDLDFENNSIIDYSIYGNFSNKLFRLNYSSGSLQLIPTQALDREHNDTYQIVILAKDRGVPPLTGNTTITVQVEDINDNSPCFVNKTFEFSVEENSPRGTKVGVIEAYDADVDENGRISYYIDSSINKGRISINETTGEISTEVVFDREEEPSTMTFPVFAADNGDHKETCNGTVQISILDVNDNVPYFQQKLYNFDVLENDENIIVGQVIAEDKDSDANSKIVYFIRGNEREKFVINETGWIKTTKPLDRETCLTYRIMIEASNSDFNTNNTSATNVVISVLDQNDNSPVFKYPTGDSIHIIHIPNNAQIGSKVITAKANDVDSGNNAAIMYRLKYANQSGDYFSVDADTGDVIVANKLNNVYKGQLDFSLEACDKGSPPLCTTSSHLRVLLTLASDRNNVNVVIIVLGISVGCFIISILILLFLIRRRIMKAPQPNSDVLSPEELLKRENQIFEPPPPDEYNIPWNDHVINSMVTTNMPNNSIDVYELDTYNVPPEIQGQTLLKGRPYGSRDDLDSIAKKKQYYASHAAGVQTMSALRRGSDSAITLNHRPSSPDYQTLDSLGGAYHTGQQPYYSSGSIMGQPTRFILTENPGVVYNPDQHSYYEIGGPECAAMTSPRVMGGSATLGRRQMSQTMGRNRPPPRIPACDYGTHVFRPIPTVTGETDEQMIESVNPGAYRFESYRTLDRTNTMGKYTYDAYKEASFV